MKLPFLTSILTLLLVFQSCEKDETVTPIVQQENPNEEPEEEEEEIETVSNVYFEFSVDMGIYSSIFKEAYIVIHNSNGELLDFKEYGEGSQLLFESTSAMNITDKLTITQVIHSQFFDGDDYYSIHTFPSIDKGSVWDIQASESTYNPDGEFSLTINDLPEWGYYNISNKDGYGVSQSSYYKWFNNPEDAEPFIESNVTWFPENDFIVSVIDGSLNLKYTDLFDVQKNDVIVLDSSDLLDFDNYLNVNMPIYETFNATVRGFETDQDFSRYGGLEISSVLNYAFDEKQNSIALGYLSRFSKFKTSISLVNDDYKYALSIYGAQPNDISVPEKGTFSITDDNLFSFNFDTDVSYTRQISVWRTPFSSDGGPRDSTNWLVYGETEIDEAVYILPEEILVRYSTLDLESLIHDSTELFIQTDSFQNFINRTFKNEKINSNYIEESMLFGNPI